MNRTCAILACAAMALPIAARAMNFEFPAVALETAERRQAFASYRLPVSAFRDGALDQIRAEGQLDVKAWRIASPVLTTLQILDPLRTQLQAKGFTVLFECADRECGGFDFRFQTEVLPEPEMHVDLGDFRYLAARREAESGTEYVSLMVSRSSESGFVQATRVGGEDAEVVLTASTKSPDATLIAGAGNTLIGQLTAVGRATLEDLSFGTGSSSLDGREFGSLGELAGFLKSDPTRRVVLVGHTDAEGTLEGNIALSRKRAMAVADLLVGEYGVAPGQISAEGIGYLAPRASNDTADGRTLNRRVEVVLASLR